MLAELLLLALGGLVLAGLAGGWRRQDDEDGPAGPRRVRIRARDGLDERRGPR